MTQTSGRGVSGVGGMGLGRGAGAVLAVLGLTAAPLWGALLMPRVGRGSV